VASSPARKAASGLEKLEKTGAVSVRARTVRARIDPVKAAFALEKTVPAKIDPAKEAFRVAARVASGPAKSVRVKVGSALEKAVVTVLERTVPAKVAIRVAAKGDFVPVESVPVREGSVLEKVAAVTALERVDSVLVKAAVTVPEASRAGATTVLGPVESGPAKGVSGPAETDRVRVGSAPAKGAAVTVLVRPEKTVPREKAAAARVPALLRPVRAKTGVTKLLQIEHLN